MASENIDAMKDESIFSESPMFTIEKLESIVAQMKNSVCKINNFISNSTGFFSKIKVDNNNEIIILISALHGIKDSEKLNLLFNNEKVAKQIKLDDSRIIFKDEKFDIVIIEIKPSDEINGSYLELDEEYSTKKSANKYNDNPIYILGYPYGNDCTFSFGKIKVMETNNEKYISHRCSSSTGSSGSPIILLENSKCIGIHLQGGKYKNGGNFLISSVNSFINKYSKEKNKLKNKQTYNNTIHQYNNNSHDNNFNSQNNQSINKDMNMNNKFNENINNQNNNNLNLNNNNNILNYQNINNDYNINNQKISNNMSAQYKINTNNLNALNSQNINNNILNNMNSQYINNMNNQPNNYANNINQYNQSINIIDQGIYDKRRNHTFRDS